jgi:hypothetical protein
VKLSVAIVAMWMNFEGWSQSRVVIQGGGTGEGGADTYGSEVKSSVAWFA